MSKLQAVLYDGAGVEIPDPDGSLARLYGLIFTSRWPKGFDTCSFRVRRNIALEWAAAGAAKLAIYDGLRLVWEGKLLGPQYDISGADEWVTLEATGHFSELVNHKIRARWVDKAPVGRLEWPATGDNQESFPHEKEEDRLLVRMAHEDQERTGAERYREIYRAPAGSTIRRVTFNWKRRTGEGLTIEVYNADTNSLIWYSRGDTGTGASGAIDFSPAASAIEFRFGPWPHHIQEDPFEDDTYRDTYDQNDYALLTNVVVYFTVTGHPSPTYHANEIVEHILAGIAAISTDYSLIDDPGLPLVPFMTANDDYVTCDAAIQAAALFGDSLYRAWGLSVWGSDSSSDGLPQAEFKARTVDDYEWRLTLAELRQFTDREQRDDVRNDIIVRYRDEKGITRYRTSADNAALKDDLSIALYDTRVETIDCSDSSADLADRAGIRYLEYHKGAAHSAPLTIGQWITTKAGERVPSSRVRGGERVKLVDYRGGTIYFLAETRYDDDGRQLAMTPDPAPVKAADVTPTGTPGTPTITVAVAEGGAAISWTSEALAEYYELRWATDDAGSGAETRYTGAATSVFIPYDEIHSFFQIRAVGYDGTASAYGDWATDVTTIYPTGISGVPGTSVVFLTVDLAVDLSHAQAGFRHWEVQRADDDIGTNATNLGTWDPGDETSGIVSQQYAQNWWEDRYCRLRPVNWLGWTGGYTTWLPIVSTSPAEGPIEDRFITYARPDITDLESLFTLQLLSFESGTWEKYPAVGGPMVDASLASTSNPLEGTTHLHKPTGVTGIGGQVSLDLSQDGRFTDDDYVVFYVAHDTVWKIDGTTITLKFFTDAARTEFFYKTFNLQGTWSAAPPIIYGYNLYYEYKAKKSEFLTVGSPDWTDTILAIGVSAGSNVEFDLDNVRIVKADPDDAEIYNPTGEVWDFSPPIGGGSSWDDLSGNRSGEPSHDYVLAQLYAATTPANWLLGWHTKSNIASGVAIVGTYVKGIDGAVALAFNINDPAVATRTMYAVEMDTAANTVTLVKWVAGVRTVLASAAFTSAPNTEYWLAADWRNGSRIEVFAATSDSNLISAANKLISVEDSAVRRGRYVGVMAYECNCRFFAIRAGSPEHAHTAEWAALAERALEADHATAADTADALTASPFPTGCMMMWPTATAPTGWLLCDGSAVSRSTYAALYAVISTTFGAGDGSTTFNVPDFQGRSPQGKDGTDAVGAAVGTKLQTSVPEHAHQERAQNGSAWYAGGTTAGRRSITAPSTTDCANAEMTENAGEAAGVDQRGPRLAVNFIIKV